MRGSLRSNFIASVLGGLVVAGTFLAFGVTGRRTTQAVIEEAPLAASQPASSNSALSLTPHYIYVRDAPGVAFIRAIVTQEMQNPFDLDPESESSSSTGSGFLVRRDGYVLTNYHLIEGADARTGITVQFGNNAARPAKVVSESPSDDLALLKVDMAGFYPSIRPLPLGDSSTVRVGDPTLAIGNPFGLDRTLTSGIVSALQRQIQAPDGFAINNVIQTDAPINPGNSGGPLIDADGNVIGINSQIMTGGDADGGSIGIAFAVPINTAKLFLPWLTSTAGAARANAAAVARISADPGAAYADAASMASMAQRASRTTASDRAGAHRRHRAQFTVAVRTRTRRRQHPSRR
jgi:S1-C subfamily serine protease